MTRSTNYDAKSVKTLVGLEPFRKNPGVYIGSTGSYGLFHIVKEITNNSVDEFLNSSVGRNIKITLTKDGGVKVSDDGRGFPHGMQDKTFSILGACFGKEHTGGKFHNGTGTSGYNSSGGMHGIGAKCAAALGIKTIATSYRDGLKDEVEFSQGKLIRQDLNIPCDKNLHGTEVLWYPDSSIFTDTIEFDNKKIERELCQEYSFLNQGLHLTIVDEKNNYSKEYYSENGIKDYLDYLNGDSDYIINPIVLQESDGDFSVEVGVAYNTKYNSTIKLYTNSIPQSKGTHLTGFKTAWTSAINSYAKEKGWLKEKDNNLTGADLEEGQILIINFKMIDPIFEGQIKDNLTSSEGRTYVQKLVSAKVKDYFSNDIKNIVDKALLAKKAAEAARKAREKAREVNSKPKSKLLNLPSKLVDANAKDRSKCELFIVEGDSAAGGLIEARDPETQAVFPIRGKMINAFKSADDKVLANQEVNNLIKALGLEFDAKTKKLIYDEKKLRYGKIFTATDADPDGASIKNLIFTNLWNLCPELFLNGHVWITIPPLFRITKGKDTYIYLKDNKALEEYKQAHRGEKYLINRNKGLGEQDSDELGPCILEPETRNVAQVVVEDTKTTEILLDILLGTSVPPRRAWLLEHAEEASDNLW